jgi:hypothetical protein
VFEHVGVKQDLGFGVRGLKRAECFSPNYFLDVGVSTNLLEAANPNTTAGMEGWVVVVLNRLRDGCPECLKG